MRKPNTKLNLMFTTLMSLIYIVAFCWAMYISISAYINSPAFKGALGTAILGGIVSSVAIIFIILFLVFAFIKLDYRYTFHGAVFVQSLYMVATGISQIAGFFIMGTFNWGTAQMHLIPGILLLLFAAAYFSLIYVKDTKRATNIGVLLAVVSILQYLGSLFGYIQNGASISTIVEAVLLMVAEVCFIYQAVRLKAASEEY